MRFLLAFLLSLKTCVCPAPIVCEIPDDTDLPKKLAYQAKEIAGLTSMAIKIESDKAKCPAPDCKCAPAKWYKHKRKKKVALPYLGFNE